MKSLKKYNRVQKRDNVNEKNILYQLESKTSSQMMSYIIKTEDSKIIVIDGGLRADCDYLLGYVKKLNGGKIKIDAWILTHAHSDHIDAFMEAKEKRYSEMNIGKIYYNFPPAEYIEKYEASEYHTIREFNALLPRFADQTIVMHEGCRYHTGVLFWDVLYEPDTALTCNVINNSSVVFKINIGGKSILITGDLGKEAGDIVLEKYGSLLKSDYVEMAHHGQNGVGRSFYEAVLPDVCLWCTPLWLWNNDAGRGYNTHLWKTVEVRGWMEEIGVKRHYVIKDGTAEIMI